MASPIDFDDTTHIYEAQRAGPQSPGARLTDTHVAARVQKMAFLCCQAHNALTVLGLPRPDTIRHGAASQFFKLGNEFDHLGATFWPRFQAPLCIHTPYMHIPFSNTVQRGDAL